MRTGLGDKFEVSKGTLMDNLAFGSTKYLPFIEISEWGLWKCSEFGISHAWKALFHSSHGVLSSVQNEGMTTDNFLASLS